MGLLTLAAAVLVGVAVTAYQRGSLDPASGDATFPLQGEPAPELRGTTLEGQQYRMRPRDSALTIVNVWASWCGPCRQELPMIADFTRRRGDRVRVVTVDTRDGPAAARSLLEEVDATDLLAVQDPSGRIAVDWGATGVPETFVVDADGIIRARAVGEVTEEWLAEQVDRWA